MTIELDLPVDTSQAAQKPRGFGTPQSQKAGQRALFLANRVIPVVFLPGIMGTNLKISDQARLQRLEREMNRSGPEANKAWRPDDIGATNFWEHTDLTAAQRQLILDPSTTTVDVYNPQSQNSELDGDDRHENLDLDWGFDSPLMQDDPPGTPNRRTAEQKARARGWSQPFFQSYGPLLQNLEQRLNKVFKWDGKATRLRSEWRDVVGVAPSTWGLVKQTPQAAMTEEDLKAVALKCWFPVYALGYNWLISNRKSASTLAERIKAIHKTFTDAKFDCPGVIVVTHSMGGMVGRALIHPKMGKVNDLVLGIVHGVQPAIGAAAGYKRMRAGFDGTSMTDKVLGHLGERVTAVLANSPGGLQLLPPKAYGNGWLQVEQAGKTVLSLPAKGDPYEEIYKRPNVWWGLMPHGERWTNPANLELKNGKTMWQQTMGYLDDAKAFHAAIEHTYHARTYAHYGADAQQRSFGTVRWLLSDPSQPGADWQAARIATDSQRGELTLNVPAKTGAAATPTLTARLAEPDEAGDGTVPMRSADHQLHHGQCKAVFRQTGYEHQGSYKDDRVLAATLYSIMRIAQEANQ